MRKLLALSAIAPLALLAACGDAPVEEEDLAVEQAGTGLEAPVDQASYAPPSDAVDGMDYSGDYSFTGLDGSESRLTLNSADNTYTYTAPGMTEPRTGSYTLADNRITIADLDDRGTAYFSVSNDALYRLADETRPYSDTEGSTIYVRGNRNTAAAAVDSPGVDSVAPDASTNSVADKRD